MLLGILFVELGEIRRLRADRAHRESVEAFFVGVIKPEVRKIVEIVRAVLVAIEERRQPVVAAPPSL